MTSSGYYILVEFDWPSSITKELATLVRKFHDLVVEADWIDETVAASGGIGGECNSIWILHIENYAILDKFLHGKNPIAENFNKWSNQLAKMKISVKEQVKFL